MVAVRNIYFPDAVINGYGSRRPIILTSAHSHYSLQNAGMIIGIGTNNVKGVECDEVGRMKPDALGILS